MSKEGRARRKTLPQMTLEDLNTVKWTCEYPWCDTCYDCETCPAWRPTDGMHEEKDIYEIYYKILPFCRHGISEDKF